MTNALRNRPVECACGRGYVRRGEPLPRCHWCGVEALAETSRLARAVLEAEWPDMPAHDVDTACADDDDALCALDEP